MSTRNWEKKLSEYIDLLLKGYLKSETNRQKCPHTNDHALVALVRSALLPSLVNTLQIAKLCNDREAVSQALDSRRLLDTIGNVFEFLCFCPTDIERQFHDTIIALIKDGDSPSQEFKDCLINLVKDILVTEESPLLVPVSEWLQKNIPDLLTCYQEINNQYVFAFLLPSYQNSQFLKSLAMRLLWDRRFQNRNSFEFIYGEYIVQLVENFSVEMRPYKDEQGQNHGLKIQFRVMRANGIITKIPGNRYADEKQFNEDFELSDGIAIRRRQLQDNPYIAFFVRRKNSRQK